MSLTKKISQLKNLDNLQPDKSWELKTKYELLSEIASQNRLMQAQKLAYGQKMDLFVFSFLNKFSPSLSKAIATFLIISLGSGVGIVAQAAVPGGILYPVKRSMEQVELSLTISSVRETEVHIKHIGKRLEEINKILADNNDNQNQDSEKKAKAIKQAVRHLEKDVTAADSSLKIAKEETNPVEVVELVKKVTNATKEVSNVLTTQTKDNVDKDEAIGAILVSAKEVNEGVQKSAVNVAIEVHEEVLAAANKKKVEASTSTNGLNVGGLDDDLSYQSSTVSFINSVKDNPEIDVQELEKVTNLVKEIVASEISDTSSKINDVKQKVDNVDEKELQNLEILDIKDIDSVKDTSVDDEVLKDAKTLLEEGFLRNAFDTIYQAKEKYQKADVVLEKIRKAILEHGTVSPEVIDELNYRETEPKENILKASMINSDSKEVDIEVDIKE